MGMAPTSYFLLPTPPYSYFLPDPELLLARANSKSSLGVESNSTLQEYASFSSTDHNSIIASTRIHLLILYSRHRQWGT